MGRERRCGPNFSPEIGMQRYLRELLRSILHVIGESVISALRAPRRCDLPERVSEHRAESEVECDLLSERALDRREPQFGEKRPDAEHIGEIEDGNAFHFVPRAKSHKRALRATTTRETSSRLSLRRPSAWLFDHERTTPSRKRTLLNFSGDCRSSRRLR